MNKHLLLLTVLLCFLLTNCNSDEKPGYLSRDKYDEMVMTYADSLIENLNELNCGINSAFEFESDGNDRLLQIFDSTSHIIGDILQYSSYFPLPYFDTISNGAKQIINSGTTIYNEYRFWNLQSGNTLILKENIENICYRNYYNIDNITELLKNNNLQTYTEMEEKALLLSGFLNKLIVAIQNSIELIDTCKTELSALSNEKNYFGKISFIEETIYYLDILTENIEEFNVYIENINSVLSEITIRCKSHQKYVNSLLSFAELSQYFTPLEAEQ